MTKLNVFGVKINQINLSQAVRVVERWVKKNSKHYIVTPNIEFLILARQDQDFKNILNRADLSIPDSSRLSWVYFETQQKNIFLKLLAAPFFLAPKLLPLHYFDTVTGTDLMEELIKHASDRGFTVGFLGGQNKIADKLKDCLLEKYPKLKITFSNSNIVVNEDGEIISPTNFTGITEPTDLLFVAFGQGKQEKWIFKNLKKQPVKVMMGVGGAFDYLSGSVPRAPLWLRNLGLEWLFRLIIQPWRIKRFLNLMKFVLLVLLK